MKKQLTRFIALALGGLTVATAALPAQAGPASSSSLSRKYHSFQASQRRETAREIVAWSQRQGAQSQGATLEQGLREFGFSRREIVQAVVQNSADGQRHAVTLWFEDRNDPWVLDPTGAAAKTMVRMSTLNPWVAIQVASNTAGYRIDNGRVQAPQRLSRAVQP